MHKRNLIQIATPFAIIIALVLVYLTPVAFSQDDMTQVPTSAFADMQRPVVRFEHDAHNEKAGIEDCVVCHHGKTDTGLMDPSTSSEGEACGSCHPVKPEHGETPLMRAFHRQCASCHATSLKGPVVCGECHRK